MAKLILYPYQRLDAADLSWSPWTATISGNATSLDAIADAWDANAELAFRIAVAVSGSGFERCGVAPDNARLVVSASCKDTAYTTVEEATFARSGQELVAEAAVTVPGQVVSESVELHAHVISRGTGPRWLARRILSERATERIALDSAIVGFPTVAFSFEEHHLPAAPWRLVVDADDAESVFAHSIRLELNEDLGPVRRLMEGASDPHVNRELVASITRVLIGTVSRLLDGTSESRSAAQIAAEAPDSIAAAAARAAAQHLRKPLNDAVQEYRRQPERFEASLAAGTGLLGDR